MNDIVRKRIYDFIEAFILHIWNNYISCFFNTTFACQPTPWSLIASYPRCVWTERKWDFCYRRRTEDFLTCYYISGQLHTEPWNKVQRNQFGFLVTFQSSQIVSLVAFKRNLTAKLVPCFLCTTVPCINCTLFCSHLDFQAAFIIQRYVLFLAGYVSIPLLKKTISPGQMILSSGNTQHQYLNNRQFLWWPPKSGFELFRNHPSHWLRKIMK